MFKKIELIFEDKPYSCELEPDNEESISCKIYQNYQLKFEGKIALKEIYSKISAFKGYTMEELFNALNELEKDKFELLNSSNKFELKIKFKVLKKFKELSISLEPKSESKADIIQSLLNQVEHQTRRIEFLENELKNQLEQHRKGRTLQNEKEEKPAKKIEEKPVKKNKKKPKEKNEEDEEKEDNSIQNLDISNIKLQRKKHLFEKDVNIEGFILLRDGRIAMNMGDKKIAIIDPNSLEIMFTIEIPLINFIALKKDTLAIIHENFKKISIIKLEEKKYTLMQEIEDRKVGFVKLLKLRDGTLLVTEWVNNKDENIIFYAEGEDDLYFNDFSISNQGHSKFIFQLTDTEILYTASDDEIIVYDFVNKLKKISFYIYGKKNLFLGSQFKVEAISEDLICLVKIEKLGYFINVREKKIIEKFKSEKKKINNLFSIKGKYLFIVKENCILQYKVEKDHVNLVSEVETTNSYNGLSYLNNEKGKKFISYDNDGNIYELY